MYLTTSNYERFKGYKSLEVAKAAFLEEIEKSEIKEDECISLGIGVDIEGKFNFRIGSYNEFTSCNWCDIETWQEWYSDFEFETDQILEEENYDLEDLLSCWNSLPEENYVNLGKGLYLQTFKDLKTEDWFIESLENEEDEDHDFAISLQDMKDDCILLSDKGSMLPVLIIDFEELKKAIAKYWN